ncbi:cytochrome P450 [Streptomyces sp. NPDC057617]|uniref:cytochrome P450 n=1 Tax=Streptomyces sp. NPDC057617 TaxID=3346184 RepID=UPI0036814176
MQSHSENQAPPPGCPAHGSGMGIPLYNREFAQNPGAYYDYMRQLGPAAHVELAPRVNAHLVTGYGLALHVLQNPDTFRRDSRRWTDLNEGRIPLDSPVLPMMVYRPGPIYSDGKEHLRLRQAMTDCLMRVDVRRMSRLVDGISEYLIDQVKGKGKVDLVKEYAQVLPLLVYNDLFGCPAELGDNLVFGISGIFDGTNAEKANQVLQEALVELVALKRAKPGDDVISWLMQHEARLTDEEMYPLIIQLVAGGTEPLGNLISSSLALLLDVVKDDEMNSGGMMVEDAIDEVLWNAAPIANYATHFPVQSVDLGGIRLNAGDPVVISFAAANTDPSLSGARQTLSKRAHLAWGAGPHACPAKDPALLISTRAIENLLKALHDIELAVPSDALTWRPGPFHRALSSLPARFTPVKTIPKEEPVPTARIAGSPRPDNAPVQKEKGPWGKFLAWWTG